MICNDCPRKCGASRSSDKGNGFCGASEKISVAKTMTHMWEEPCLSGYGTDYYSGTENVFLFGCNLHCVFCQNAKISINCNEFDTKKLSCYSPEEFGEFLLKISKGSANNIGLVSGDHYIGQISEAITDEIKSSIKKPIVFNGNGYEKPEMLELLRGKIDVFMPDFKYSEEGIAKSYSYAPDYPEIAKNSVKKAFEIVGPCKFDEKGLITKGVIIRHLIMPGNVQNTLKVIDWVNETFKPGDVVFSLMSQYTPMRNDFADKKLNRPISRTEKSKCLEYLSSCENITLAYTQEDGAISESFIPDFNSVS